jgi:putative DNA primase/helicase
MGAARFGALPRLVMGAAKNEADGGEDKPERIMVRIKSNIGPSGGGFGYHIDTAPLHEQPDIEATRIVWEYELEGTARELLAEAEGDQNDGKVPKLDQAKQLLRTTLAQTEQRQTEIQALAKAEGISWATLKRASEEGEVIKRKNGIAGGWWWSLARRSSKPLSQKLEMLRRSAPLRRSSNLYSLTC